jgi:hypothetical protein
MLQPVLIVIRTMITMAIAVMDTDHMPPRMDTHHMRPRMDTDLGDHMRPHLDLERIGHLRVQHGVPDGGDAISSRH